MSANIFEIDSWTSGNAYLKNDIVKYSGLYYYAINDISSSTTTPDTDTTNFAGRKIDQDGTNRPQFIWLCSYGFTVNRQPVIKNIQLGDGYEQRVVGSLNNNLIDSDLTFDDRTNKETRAIEHFLSTQAGVTAFLFVAPGVFGKEKLFVCKQWNNTNKFYNNNSIRAKFLEVPA